MKLTHEQAIAVLKRYARELVRFKESSYPDDDQLMVIGFLMPGNFGSGDDFFDAMRALRKTPKRAAEQAARRK